MPRRIAIKAYFQEIELKEKDIILAYLQAHNDHDVDLALSTMSPEIRFGMAGIWVKEGTEEVSAMEKWDAAMNSQLTFENLKIRNGRLECVGRETNDWYQMSGIQEVHYEAIKFEFENGLIRHIRAQMAHKSERKIDQVVNDVIRWALDIYPDEVEEIIPRGNFIYGHEQALRWKALLEKWLKSRPPQEEE